MMEGPASGTADEKTIMTDVGPGQCHRFELPGEVCLKARRTTSDLRVSSAAQETALWTAVPTDGTPSCTPSPTPGDGPEALHDRRSGQR